MLSNISSRYSGFERALSVSSMRKMNCPPWALAYIQLKSAVRPPPMCRYPVGDGAKRTRTMLFLLVLFVEGDEVGNDPQQSGLFHFVHGLEFQAHRIKVLACLPDRQACLARDSLNTYDP